MFDLLPLFFGSKAFTLSKYWILKSMNFNRLMSSLAMGPKKVSVAIYISRWSDFPPKWTSNLLVPHLLIGFLCPGFCIYVIILNVLTSFFKTESTSIAATRYKYSSLLLQYLLEDLYCRVLDTKIPMVIKRFTLNLKIHTYGGRD